MTRMGSWGGMRISSVGLYVMAVRSGPILFCFPHQRFCFSIRGRSATTTDTAFELSLHFCFVWVGGRTGGGGGGGAR